MGICTSKDTAFIEKLVKHNVLQDLKPERIPAQDGTVIVACADGEQAPDLLTKHWEVCNGRDCHHSLMLNGGPLLIPTDSPVAEFGEGQVILEHSRGGRKLKGVKNIVLYGHWPCGAAGIHELSLSESLILCVEAKNTVRAYYGKFDEYPEVLLFFHVAMPRGRRTYYFSRENWEKFRRS